MNKNQWEAGMSAENGCDAHALKSSQKFCIDDARLALEKTGAVKRQQVSRGKG
jgi:hypothetical protein